jgi:hypothetical protein
MAIKHGAPAPSELVIWNLAERFGWTLEYCRSLSWQDWVDFVNIEDARKKARNKPK